MEPPEKPPPENDPPEPPLNDPPEKPPPLNDDPPELPDALPLGRPELPCAFARLAQASTVSPIVPDATIHLTCRFRQTRMRHLLRISGNGYPPILPSGIIADIFTFRKGRRQLAGISAHGQHGRFSVPFAPIYLDEPDRQSRQAMIFYLSCRNFGGRGGDEPI
jgi:hypothetical protein